MLMNLAVDRMFSLGTSLLVGLTLVFLAGAAAAELEGIDLSSPAAPVAAGDCPRLIQIKYPFLNCANGEIGQDAADENWDNSRRMDTMSDWIEDDQNIGVAR